MKEKTLFTLYREFENWSNQLTFACQKGCANCCTQNVTMTQLEGELILQFIRTKKMEVWFANALETLHEIHPPSITANDYAAACLQGQEVEPGGKDNPTACPFLENECCKIYVVRPFGCRCFGSLTRCTPGQTALLPEYYITASTAIMQIIENLDQGRYWGNIIHTLLSLCDREENQHISQLLDDPSIILHSQKLMLRAKPLPGFLIPKEDHKHVSMLLDTIFSKGVAGK